MINIYLNQTHEFQQVTSEDMSLLQDSIWIDLLNPTPEEEKLVETMTGLDIPTRQEMQEIEFSSRLYRSKGNFYMTGLMIAYADSADPKLDPVTLILTPKQLITIRYIEPLTFKLFFSRVKTLQLSLLHASDLFMELLDVTVDRLADILEMIGRQLDESSHTIFRPKKVDSTFKNLNYRQLLQHIGAYGDLNTKARESLITFNRMITFAGKANGIKFSEDNQTHLINLAKDIESLSNHADFLSTKVNFLLEATLGMVNINQNNTIKIVSIASVIFLPPTLIASIYGMNFKMMPELSWHLGYPIAILLMILSAFLPYKYFKHRGWL